MDLKNKNNWRSSERKENAFHFFFFAYCSGYNAMSSKSAENPDDPPPFFFFTAADSVFYSLTDFACAFVYGWLYLCACGDQRSTLGVIPCF